MNRPVPHTVCHLVLDQVFVKSLHRPRRKEDTRHLTPSLPRLSETMSVDANSTAHSFVGYLSQKQVNLLVVFDMDHTMVGDLVSLSDR